MREAARRSDVHGIELRPADRVELIVSDSSLARALFEGIPAARMLGRARLANNEGDATMTSSPASSFETLLRRLLGESRASMEKVRRAVARHTRVAVDEGPLDATEGTIAALVYAVSSSSEPDASLSEIFPISSEPPACDPMVARACAAFDPRLASARADRRAPLFEACVRLAARATLGPFPWEYLREAAEELHGPELAFTLLRPLSGSLFPPRMDEALLAGSRRMVQLDRAELDALVAKDPRELAPALSRAERSRASSMHLHLDTLIANLTVLLANPGALVLAIPPLDKFEPLEVAAPKSGEARPSWLPHEWSGPDAAAAVAAALERNTASASRVRAAVLSGGEPALDAIGGEMLHVSAHPYASACFAEILARSGRPRDVMRLVTYFAVAPDPSAAARALSVCGAPELPRVLSAWLEAMLPADGEMAPQGDDPETSSAARLTACVASLAPYPHLYRAVRPLLSRVSEAPPPASG